MLVVGGRDRLRFLHAVTTQDVARLEPGAGAYGAMTDDLGRPVSDFRLYVLPEAVLLESPRGASDALRAALERLVVADDVVLAWAEGDPVLHEAFAAAAAPSPLSVEWAADTDPAPGEDLADEGVLARVPLRRRAAIHASRFGGGGTLAWGVAAAGTPAPEVELDALEMESFHPGPAEFAEAKVWNELDLLEAVSFSKGCFTGQEILNRVQTRGQLKRRLVVLHLDAAALPAGAWNGAALATTGGEPAGKVTRAARDRAFAFVPATVWEPGTRVLAQRPGAPGETLGAVVHPRSISEVS